MSAPMPPPWRCRKRRTSKSKDMVLIVDVGTNAEILLGNKTRVLACSSPTGPAFEGAQISLGPARRARRHRAGGDRPRHQGAALPRDRLRPVVGRPRLCRGDRQDRRHRHLRVGHHRGGGRMRMAGLVDARG
jgi:hypothetical protein